MSDYNHVGIAGRLTRDAELRYVASGTAVLDLSLASNRKFKDKEETVFVDVTVWGKQAETLAQYLVKGKYVMVGGRLKFESWDSDAGKRTKVCIVADSVDFVPLATNAQSSSDTTSDVSNEPVVAGDGNIPF